MKTCECCGEYNGWYGGYYGGYCGDCHECIYDMLEEWDRLDAMREIAREEAERAAKKFPKSKLTPYPYGRAELLD